MAEFASLGVRDTGVKDGCGCPRILAFEAQLRAARAATVREMRCRHPQWTEDLLEAKRRKKAKGRSTSAMSPWERESLEDKAVASAFAVIIQGYEDMCLMTAARVIGEAGWIIHSLQQDGLLVEPGYFHAARQSAPAVRAESLASLLPRVMHTMEAEHGICMVMIEKPFHLEARDDLALEAIIADLHYPLTTPPPPRPEAPRVSGVHVRHTAQETDKIRRSCAVRWRAVRRRCLPRRHLYVRREGVLQPSRCVPAAFRPSTTSSTQMLRLHEPPNTGKP